MGLEEFMKPSLLEITYRKIKEDITFGRLAPGQRLIVSELSKEFGISHTPINEALNRLVTEGLVQAIPRKGMQVRKITLDEIEEVLEARLMCETFCVEPAIARVKSHPEVLKNFAECLRDYQEAVSMKDINDNKRHVEIEMQFHLSYINLCGNRRITQIYEGLKANQYALYAYATKKVPLSDRRYEEIIKEHNDVYNALSRHDSQKLNRAIKTHIDNVRDDILYLIEEDKAIGLSD